MKHDIAIRIWLIEQQSLSYNYVGNFVTFFKYELTFTSRILQVNTLADRYLRLTLERIWLKIRIK